MKAITRPIMRAIIAILFAKMGHTMTRRALGFQVHARTARISATKGARRTAKKAYVILKQESANADYFGVEAAARKEKCRRPALFLDTLF